METSWFDFGPKTCYNSQVFEDLEILTTIFDSINLTKTEPGERFLKEILLRPTSDIPYLKDRQREIYHLKYSEEFRNSCEWYLEQMSQKHSQDLDCLLCFYEDISEEANMHYDTVFFNRNYLNFLNNFPSLLHASNTISILILPIFTLVSPLLSVIFPLLIAKFLGYNLSWQFIWIIVSKYLLTFFWKSFFSLFQQFGHIGAVIGAVWFALFCYGTYLNFKEAWDKYQTIVQVHNKLNRIARLLRAVSTLYFHPGNKYFKNPTIEEALIRSLAIFDDADNNNVFKKNPGIFSDKGYILTIFQELIVERRLGSLRDDLELIIEYIGWIDAYLSIVKLTEFGDKKPYSFSAYIYPSTVDRPQIDVRNLWHPTLNPAIFNSISTDRNILLTGPNQGGKSTFIKALFLNLWLGQTLTVSNCEHIRFTPFSILHSYIRTQDSVGHESLFEAEMNRMKEYLEIIDSLETNNGFSFAVIDEIFTSTNFQEGLAAALAICEELQNYPRNLTIVTTHYHELAKVGFKNYKVVIDRGTDTKQIKFLYKVDEGISKDRIALDLLERRGFKSKILLRAQECLNNFRSQVRGYMLEINELLI